MSNTTPDELVSEHDRADLETLAAEQRERLAMIGGPAPADEAIEAPEDNLENTAGK
jgi:hypothetical protein